MMPSLRKQRMMKKEGIVAPCIPLMDRLGWSYLSYLFVSLFFPPLALLIPILLFYREITWAIAISMICGALFVPAGIVPKLFALVTALVCLWCLNAEKIVAWFNRTPRGRKKLPEGDAWSRPMGFAFAALFVPAYLYVAIVWSRRQSP